MSMLINERAWLHLFYLDIGVSVFHKLNFEGFLIHCVFPVCSHLLGGDLHTATILAANFKQCVGNLPQTTYAYRVH